MKRALQSIMAGSLFMLPFITNAQFLDGDGSDTAFANFLDAVVDFSNDILIPTILAIGFLAFVWGMFVYFIAGGANDDKKEKGKSLMIYAILGFVLVIVFWGIVNLIAGSIGTDDGINNIPTGPSLDGTGGTGGTGGT
jgi:hypothetical protein